MNTYKKPKLWLIILAFAATYIVWGTTYIAIVIGIKTLPPFIMATIRFSIAGTILLLICRIKGEAIFIPGIFKRLILGSVIVTGGQGSLFWAEKYIASGYTAILVSTLPLWYVLLDKKNWLNYFKNKFILTGLLFGFVGIILLFKQQVAASPSGDNTMNALALLAIIFSCICWTGGTLYFKNQHMQHSMFLNLGWQLLGGAISSSIISFIGKEFNGFSFTEVSNDSWFAVIYLAIAGSLLAFIAFNWLMTVKPAAIVGTYAYVNPVIAVLLGWLIASESISATQIIGMVIILISAFIVNMAKETKNVNLSVKAPSEKIKLPTNVLSKS